MRYVIIGNSTAAVGCIEGIRLIDKESPIFVISDEPYHTYSRPLISYLLYGKTDLERMKYRDNDFYKKNNVTAYLGKTVTKIDNDKKEVVIDNEERIAFDKLLIATGARPFVPPINGLDTVKNKFTFMKLDDALALQKAVNKESRVLVLGAGLIGLKCVEGIFDKVKEINVVDMADRILPSILDEKGAELIKTFLEEKGVAFKLGTSIAELKENEAVLTDGRSVTFDILVLAVGVRPNVELAKEIGIEVNRGIIINSHCETNLKDIYAAGDCCECFDISIDKKRILALLPNAYMQGECAGMNMAGDTEKVFDKAIPMNAIGFFGYHIITAGSYDGESYIKEDGVNYKRLITKDNLLKGFILIGDIERAGIYTSMIRDKVPLDSVDFDLLKEAAQLMAFSKEERAKKLGGVK